MRAVLLGLSLLAAGPALAQDKEKFVGTNADIRTILHFKVSDAAVKKLLPEGWEVDSPISGPFKDINFRVTFIDRLLNRDPEGKELSPIRTASLGVPVRKTGTQTLGTMVVMGLSSHQSGVPGAYGVGVLATADMERKIRIDAAGTATVEESWQFNAAEGTQIQLQIQYVRGMPAAGKAEPKVYSAIKPDFYRIYRLEQAVDVVRGAGVETDRVRKITFKASGAKLAPLFDGSEQLISVTSIPWYTRQTYLPGS
jgi:hypothetical protein